MKNANPVWRAAAGGVWLVLIALLAGCHRPEAAGTTKSATDHFDVGLGGRVVRLQLAVTMPEMERGLMERKDLGPDEGMLFVYDRPQRMSFWMRNTPTPLDIGFFDSSGMLEEIYPMQPFDETGVQSRSTLLCLALETNQGWFRERGIKPGARIDVAAVRAALKARGFDPTKYAIGR